MSSQQHSFREDTPQPVPMPRTRPRNAEAKFVRFRGDATAVCSALDQAGHRHSLATDLVPPFTGTHKVFLDDTREVPTFLKYLPTQFVKVNAAWQLRRDQRGSLGNYRTGATRRAHSADSTADMDHGASFRR